MAGNRKEQTVVEVMIVREEAATVCRPAGELDAYSVQAFRDHLAELAGEPSVVIDLSEVPFMDSAGLGALIGGIRKIREAEGEVVVVCDRAAVLRLLHTTRFDRMVSVVASCDDAYAEFNSTLE
ncbi:MAG: STAS domain-containing protein [Microthrixaceae bacterium]|nr:STAS domain-containing protein [Microthrixaceae bacterium]MCO5311545.1 STAS domain-containing protein [Microthrixaceae bacterium]